MHRQVPNHRATRERCRVKKRVLAMVLRLNRNGETGVQWFGVSALLISAWASCCRFKGFGQCEGLIKWNDNGRFPRFFYVCGCENVWGWLAGS